MGLFRRKRKVTDDAVREIEVTVLDYPTDGWSWKVTAIDHRAATRAVNESGFEVEPGTHTDEDETLIVLQQMKDGRVLVTMGSQILGQVPDSEVERVSNRLRRGGQIAAAPARLYRHTPEQTTRIGEWTIVVYA